MASTPSTVARLLHRTLSPRGAGLHSRPCRNTGQEVADEHRKIRSDASLLAVVIQRSIGAGSSPCQFIDRERPPDSPCPSEDPWPRTEGDRMSEIDLSQAYPPADLPYEDPSGYFVVKRAVDVVLASVAIAPPAAVVPHRRFSDQGGWSRPGDLRSAAARWPADREGRQPRLGRRDVHDAQVQDDGGRGRRLPTSGLHDGVPHWRRGSAGIPPTWTESGRVIPAFGRSPSDACRRRPTQTQSG